MAITAGNHEHTDRDDARSRRSFLATAGAAGVVATAAQVPLSAPRATAATPRAGRSPRTVAIFGAGTAGLTAAHELAERGYRVTVYERKSALGGKARSMDVPGTGRGGRLPLPGEHGFRFFPGFYLNLPETLSRIPFPGNRNGCKDNLVDVAEELFARSGGRPDLRLPFRSVEAPPSRLTPDALLQMLTGLLDTTLRLPASEVVYFAQRLLVYLTSSERRRVEQWERTRWWEYIKAERMSADYQRLLAIGLTRNIVATKAEEASTHTVAHIFEAFLFSFLGRGNDGEPDRVLNAPTNEAWIDPWLRYLRAHGVRFETGSPLRELRYESGQITGAVVEDAATGTRRTVTADYYVSALPVEHARGTWGPRLRAADPQLGRCDALMTDWMTGVQFYLRERTPIVHGHVNYLDSPWAITSISQAQMWPGRDFAADYGDGTAADCFSTIVSEWDQPGILYGKTAKQCTKEEIVKEVWAQIKAALNDSGRAVLRDDLIHSWFMDPAVEGLGGPRPTNDEQLLVHPAGTLHNRPTAHTAVPNLFLAGDYVVNDMDLATMEGANETGRAAANALLKADGSGATPCTVQTLFQPPELAGLKRHDETRFRLGLPNAFDLG
ncbi:FAD-dependent oxidoreductase [Streptomyces sp. SAJ15]|uniref:hydroxysqualene dehydroxylase n=1 Tax=Streptomyces sp. SAJ15 TaxID=2011095 RepID=UPI0011865589|nr:FAD-dependent oxidoreductase [Streptomyces sp. SAJ15]TVL93765.1 FAD-dependent oxidoreductase [Streptomyces sp. SAJ15]